MDPADISVKEGDNQLLEAIAREQTLHLLFSLFLEETPSYCYHAF